MDDDPITLFSDPAKAHASRPLPFSPFPIGKRHPTARPTLFSRIPRGTDISSAVFGSELLGLPLLPQGEQVAALLEARDKDGLEHLYPKAVVMEPRRSSKTTAIWATLIGRCHRTPGYRVVTTAQDGSRAGEIIREFMAMLDAAGFEGRGLGDLFWSNGKERIKFRNRAVIWTVAPKPGTFRSAAADVILFDEAGELEPEKGQALLAGALPLMDTRDAPQVIITGTPSVGRAGLLWETLQKARSKEPGTGILDYSIRDDEQSVTIANDGTVTLNEKILRRVHPGIGTLTTIERMRDRLKDLGLTKFEMEYLCRFPADAETDAISPEAWRELKVPIVDRPEHVGIAFDCAVDSSSASITYAWRDAAGVAYVELVEHRLSTSWVAGQAHRAVVKYSRRVPVAYDDIGANRDPAAAIERMKPAPKLTRLNTKDIMGAATRLANEVAAGTLRHFGQLDLDAAIGNLTWRDIGLSGRAFGPKSYTGPPINPAVAASLALWSYDRTPKRTRIEIVA